MKKIPSLLQRILITVMALMLGLSSVGTQIAWANAQVINSYLGAKSFDVIEDPASADLDTEYFKSDYSNLGDLISAGAKMTEEVMVEGAVLLKNDNDALPLSRGDKVSVFGTASADPVYGGSGSGSVDISKAINFTTAFESEDGAGLLMNPTLKDKYAGEWFTKPAGGGWPPKYEDYDTSIHFRRHDSFYFDGSGDKYIGEVPWNLIAEGAGNTFATYGDAAIYIIARVGGEGTDSKMETAIDGLNGDYLTLNQKERDNLMGLSELRRNGTFKKLIVILNGAIVPELDFIKDNDEFAVDACLWIGGLGQNGATGVGKLLVGDSAPSGHTSDTLWYDNAQNPANVNFGVFQFTNEDEFESFGIPLNQGNNNVLRPAHTSYVAYQEGLYLGYKYTETRYEDVSMGTPNAGAFDYNKAVAYPFGYGLSYTQFAFDNFTVRKTDNKHYAVSVDVTNVGNTYSGKESVQIYVSKPYGDYAKQHNIQVPSVELIDFGKTGVLAPGQKETVTVTVDEKYFASYDTFGEGTYILMDGTYYITAATDAHNAVNNVLAKKGYSVEGGNANMVEAITLSFDSQKYRFSDGTGVEIGNLFDFVDMNTYSGRGDNAIAYYDRANWEGTVSLNRADYVKLSLTSQMAEEMMAQTPDGSTTYNMPKYPIPTDDEWYAAHPDDNQYPRKNPAYGVGRVTDDLASIMLVSMMKDDEGNAISYNDPSWDIFMDQLTWDEQLTLITVGMHVTAGIDSIAKPISKDENGPNGFNQVYGAGQNGLAYRTEAKLGHIDETGALTDAADPNTKLKTTAMPTNGVIAATFNKDVAYRAGLIIGEDGIWSGNSGIYGIGANLHRSQYEGRTAEYYSEDGLLTGLIAGYECKGIEDKGVHVYNKHCVLNEQEDTRHGIATWVTEQALRETYLRPFEMCITVGNAFNIMSSLNRLGTIAAPACGPLAEEYLRGECGMKGIIVTDMYTDMTGYRTIAPYYQMTYGIYYGGADLPDGNNIQTPDKEEGMFNQYKPDTQGEGSYSRMAWRIRESAKRVLYASVHSNAMNGLSSGTTIHQVLASWQIALIAVNIILAVALVASIAWTILTYTRYRKKAK